MGMPCAEAVANVLARDDPLSLLWRPFQGFTPAKRPRDARLGMTKEATKDEGLAKTGSKSLLAPVPPSAKSSPGAVLPRPSIDPTMPGECFTRTLPDHVSIRHSHARVGALQFCGPMERSGGLGC